MANIKLVIDIDEDDVHRIVSGFANEDDAILFADLLNSSTPYETVTEFADRCRECGAKYTKLLGGQEPCEDAISRQAVLKMAYDISEIDGEHFPVPYMVVDIADIQKLQPVNPK